MLSTIGYAPGLRVEFTVEVDRCNVLQLFKRALVSQRIKEQELREFLLNPRFRIVGTGSVLRKGRHTGVYTCYLHYFLLESFITFDDPLSKDKINSYFKEYDQRIFRVINKCRTEFSYVREKLEWIKK